MSAEAEMTPLVRERFERASEALESLEKQWEEIEAARRQEGIAIESIRSASDRVANMASKMGRLCRDTKSALEASMEILSMMSGQGADLSARYQELPDRIVGVLESHTELMLGGFAEAAEGALDKHAKRVADELRASADRSFDEQTQRIEAHHQSYLDGLKGTTESLMQAESRRTLEGIREEVGGGMQDIPEMVSSMLVEQAERLRTLHESRMTTFNKQAARYIGTEVRKVKETHDSQLAELQAGMAGLSSFVDQHLGALQSQLDQEKRAHNTLRVRVGQMPARVRHKYGL